MATAKSELKVVISAKDEASAKIKRTSATFDKLKMIGVGAMAGIAAGAAATVKEFATFEKGMSEVKAITGATGKDFDALTDLAKEMGATTAFTAKEASDAMKFLGMAGFTTEDIIQSLQGTMNLAAAAAVDLGTSADIASNVLTGFQLDASQADRVVDVLAKTITTSNTDLMQLGEAMKFFAPTAAAFGVTVEEASAVVGLLGNAGIQGSLATRALGTALTRLSKPTARMKELQEELNLEFFNAEGQFIGLKGLVEELETGFDGLTDEQRQNAVATIFGAEAIQEINVLLAAGSQEVGRYTKELEESGGTAQKMADTQLDNLIGALTLFKSAVSGAAIELGAQLAPFLRTAIEALTNMFNVIQEKGGIVKVLQDNVGGFLDELEEKTGFITFAKESFASLGRTMRDDVLPMIKEHKDEFILLAKVLGGALFLGFVGAINILNIAIKTLVAVINVLTAARNGISSLGSTAIFAFRQFSAAIQVVFFPIIKTISLISTLISKISEARAAFSGLPGGGGGSFQKGTTFVPETGLFMLHKGEQVVPAGANVTTEQNVDVNFNNPTVRSDDDMDRLISTVKNSLNRDLRLEQIGV